MIYIVDNFLAIAGASLASVLLGMVWYRLPPQSHGATLGVLAICTFWLSAILAGAIILAPSEANATIMAYGSAVVIWAGFVLPTIVVSHRVRGLAVTASVSDCLYWLVVGLLGVAVMTTIGLSAPASAAG